MSQISGKNNRLTYRILEEEDQDIAVKFVQTYFIPYEPLSIASGVKAAVERYFPHIIIKNALWQGASIGVFDSSTGQLCAIRINSLGKNDEVILEQDTDSMYSDELKATYRVLDMVKGEGLKNIAGTKHYMEHVLVAVSQDYTKRGIASELYERSEVLAREHGCEKMFATCSSAYTRRSVEKVGYVLINEIVYQEYVDEATKEKLFAHIKSPHKGISLMMKSLQ